MRNLPPLALLAVWLSAQTAPELVVSVGHAHAPSYAAFAGGYLATAALSNVALIDLSSGLSVGHLPHGSLVQALETSPAGGLLAVGTCDHSIQLWDLASRTVRRRLPLAQECAESVSFSPDGALLAAAVYGCCAGGGLQIWDVRTGKLARALGASGFRRVVFSGDGRWLVGVDDKGRATQFEWPSGRSLRTFDGLEGPGATESAALASREGRYFAWLGRGELMVWDMKSGDRILLPGATASAADFLNDGRLAYVDDDRLMIATLPGGRVQASPLAAPGIDWHGDVGITRPLRWLRIRRDGVMLAGAYETRTVVWDVGAARLRELTAPALVYPTSLQWSRSGLIAWTDLESGVRAWDDRSGQPVDLAQDIDSATTLAFSPDGTRLAVADHSAMHIVDVRSRRSVASIELPVTLRAGVAFTPDGSRVAFETSEGLAILDGSLRGETRVSPLEEYTSAEHIAFSPDGRWIAAGLGGPNPTLRVWPSSGSGAAVTLERDRLTYGPQPPAFSHDSRRLASFSRGESVMVWATGPWSVERTWSLPGSGQALAFAPDDSRLAVAGQGEAAIWDASTGRKLVALSHPGSPVATEIAWSPDGARLVSAADDGVVRFWKASDGRLIASLFTFGSNRDWLLVAPDGRMDGTDGALDTLVAWRTRGRVARDRALTNGRRVRGLWRSLSATVPGR